MQLVDALLVCVFELRKIIILYIVILEDICVQNLQEAEDRRNEGSTAEGSLR